MADTAGRSRFVPMFVGRILALPPRRQGPTARDANSYFSMTRRIGYVEVRSSILTNLLLLMTMPTMGAPEDAALKVPSELTV